MEEEEEVATPATANPSNTSADEAAAAAASLFPLSASASGGGPQSTSPWLRNFSFTTDLAVVNDAVSARCNQGGIIETEEEDEDDEEDDRKGERAKKPTPSASSYQLVESSDTDRDDGDTRERGKRPRKKNKKRRKRSASDDDGRPGRFSFLRGLRQSSARAWAGSETKSLSKDYHVDSRGDPDNLAFGSIYRLDVPRYKLHNSIRKLEGHVRAYSRSNNKGLLFEEESDLNTLDGQLKSSGRYWSAKYSALERHKNFRKLRIFLHEKPSDFSVDYFIPLVERDDDDIGSSPGTTDLEESWEDEVLRKTREFNKMTRENPNDVKLWMDFAEFQDKLAVLQPQKGARLQMLEKKISILEKATELNPYDEDLLISLLKSYQRRDSVENLITRWEKTLMQHSGSCKLWREFLHIVQGEFSTFKVSEMRKYYAYAIQALSATASKKNRQVLSYSNFQSPIFLPLIPQNLKCFFKRSFVRRFGQITSYEAINGSHCYGVRRPLDSMAFHEDRVIDPQSSDVSLVELEIGIVDVFLSLCRFEWQAGYQELATALFQAVVEYSLFAPSLQFTEQSKRRLFEHFWSSGGARAGEDDAPGWSTWMEKEEERRRKAMSTISEKEEEQGGWTGWFAPSVKTEDDGLNSNIAGGADEGGDLTEENYDVTEDDVALLKMLGINVDTDATDEVKDAETWARWSEEELLRDHNQWMPIRADSGASNGEEGNDGEGEQLSRVVLFEDVSEYLFSLNSEEARLSLVYQFIDFFYGNVSQSICTNSSSWTEKMWSLDFLPNSIVEELRKVHDALTGGGSGTAGSSLEALLQCENNSRRTDMMRFLRNIILLCLTIFPRNFILQHALLVAEEQFIVGTNGSHTASTPCQALAKRLLKSDRQDVLLCGVYAQREATFGNIEHARKVFDMALSSISGHQLEIRSLAPVLYLWYCEAELLNDSARSDASSRVLHILSCLGSGAGYSPYKSQPSNLQLLRAHQGFKEHMRTVQSSWICGLVDYGSVALVCCAALFEELTTGWTSGVKVVSDALSIMLKEKRGQSRHLEYLFNYYMRMLKRHIQKAGLSNVLQSVLQGLQIYPSSPQVFQSLVEICHLYSVPNKLRQIFDDHSQKKPSVVSQLFALSFEMPRSGSQHRIHGLFERALANDRLHSSVLLWRCYIAYQVNVVGDMATAKRIFFRAIHACPWSKKLWLDGFSKLNKVLSGKELSDLQEVMREKELNLRTDIYEILLQDDFMDKGQVR